MAKKKDLHPAAEAALMLKDLVRDLEIFAAGRGTTDRFLAIQCELFKVGDLIQTFSPFRKPAPPPSTEPKQIVRKAMAIEHKPNLWTE